ncbi:MAG: toll/interleukin-1 receptor domain-containing protein, partial [Xanthobacteraceae bacterium]
EKFKVFISYSRRDSTEFVDELVARLELAGFVPFLDRHDIAAGEKWEERLGALIGQTDTVVFVVSPEAVKSERCAREVKTAHANTLVRVLRPISEGFQGRPEGLSKRE